MTKQDFLTALRESLTGLPKSDVEERIDFYAEMIADRMEDGLTEAEAVAAIGSVEEIAAQIVDDYPIGKLVKQKMRPKRRLSAWEIVLLVLGSPVWLSLLISLFAVLLSLYAVLWSVIVSFWSMFAAWIGSSLGTLVGGVYLLCTGSIPTGLVSIAAAFVCAGLAIFAFFGCKAATKGVARLTKSALRAMKKACMRKGEVQ